MAAVVLLGAMGGSTARAEDQTKFDVYGFVMTDAGSDKVAVDPDWFDVQRPTKLPSFTDEFGKGGNAFFSVRQTRFGVKSSTPTAMGDLKTQFEWELFGVGPDAGQTTIRLRHAYGELGKWGAGQYWSPFMDIDVFPNTLEYWGPNGMVFFRNVQFRYMPIQGDTRMTIALERPGASGDAGVAPDLVNTSGIVSRFPVPDLSAEYRMGKPWGYVELAGIMRRISWDDLNSVPPPGQDLSGNVTGWGLNLSSNLKVGPSNVLRLQIVHGEGIENYMNDAPVDVGAKADPSNPSKPVVGMALPVTGTVAFLDHNWSDKMSSSIGYSRVDVDNSDLQTPDAFKDGQYAVGNLLFTPVPNFMYGVEFGWTHRENNSDGWKVDNYHLQVSAKYNFAYHLGGSQ
jgi:hypothetical protein